MTTERDRTTGAHGNNSISGNAGFGVNNLTPGVVVQAPNNWWGAATGPRHVSNPSGTGDKVSNGVNFTPFLTAAP